MPSNPSRIRWSTFTCACLLWCTMNVASQAAAPVRVGIGTADITPDVKKNAVWIAGYGQNRKAAGVHDPLFARALVLNDGTTKIALVAADVVGLQYPTVQEIRKKLDGYSYVMISSTHNHEGPDTVGLWGPNPFTSGVDPAWIEKVGDGVVEAVRKADAAAQPVSAAYGTATDDSLLRDSRQPHVPDGVLRVVKLMPVGGTKPNGLIVQWNCHPEALGSENKQITADFPWATIKKLDAQYHCPIVYFSGAVGGLMTTPTNHYKSRGISDATFEYAKQYGEDVADLAIKAIESAKPLELAPVGYSAKPISVPLENPLYRVARMANVLKREGRVWTGNFEELGPPLTSDKAKEQSAGVSEVAYVRLGDLHVACIPGEIYPETVYGKYQEPADPNADFPDAPLEPAIMQTLPGEKTLIIGLANDELGYIVPKRQWDTAPPFAYGRKKAQYGEENSCGPLVAGILMGALKNRVDDYQRSTGK